MRGRGNKPFNRSLAAAWLLWSLNNVVRLWLFIVALSSIYWQCWAMKAYVRVPGSSGLVTNERRLLSL